ncbi:MAG: phosphoribosylamine--glycine ligase [Bacteroidia bacterium]|nr:phosphoribosylamine--glycine ligase [Bacteroidia bacterium]
MKILVIGAGGREHALAWKYAQSASCESVFIAPGNAGTAEVGENVALDVTDYAAVAAFVQDQDIDLVVIGPEQPLVDGMADYLVGQHITTLGPSQAAAQLEGSKDFSKAFMDKYKIPTAKYASFHTHELDKALDYVSQHPLPIVVKASGLAAGKGVLICESHGHAKDVVRDMLSGASFGEAGSTVVIEEFLQGIEISIFVLTDGKDYLLLPSAKDYKRIGEGDTGLNTGGMGAVSPVPFANDAFLEQVRTTIVEPTVNGIHAEGLDYKGFIFIGLMVVNGVPQVLEYNVRMGDPETEVVMPRLLGDFAALSLAAAEGRLAGETIEMDPRTCVTVMMVSGGYPGDYQKGIAISGIEQVDGSLVFHAGTKIHNGQLVTNGGRVIAVSSFGDNIEAAVSQSLQNVAHIEFDGRFYRRDIGRDLMNL